MKWFIFSLVLILILLGSASLDAQQTPDVIIVVIEKNLGELQTVGMARTALAGELAKGGWTVIDTNAFPVTLSGEDLNEYVLNKEGKNGKYAKKGDISAHFSSDGSFAFSSSTEESMFHNMDLRHLKWRIDLDKLIQEASAKGAHFILYGEVITQEQAGGGPEAFAGQGFTSCLAITNLKLIEASSRRVINTFVDQVPGMQVQKSAAGLAALQNAGKKAGIYFVKELNNTKGKN